MANPGMVRVDPIADTWAAHQWSLEEALGASHLSVGESGGSYPDQESREFTPVLSMGIPGS